MKWQEDIVKYIVNTHGHMDHIAANSVVKEGTDAKLVIHVEDEPLLSNPMNLSLYMGRARSPPRIDHSWETSLQWRTGLLRCIHPAH